MAWRVWDQKNRAAAAHTSTKRLIAVKAFCIALLLSIAVLGASVTRFQLELRAMMMAGAVIIAFQAIRAHRYFFTAVFAAMALLYNPAFPVFGLSSSANTAIALGSLIPFAASLIWLNSGPAADGYWLYPNRGWSRERTKGRS